MAGPTEYLTSSLVQIGRLLVSKGADINTRDKANQIPLSVRTSPPSLASLVF